MVVNGIDKIIIKKKIDLMNNDNHKLIQIGLFSTT